MDTSSLTEDFTESDLQHLNLIYHAGTNLLKEINGTLSTRIVANESDALYSLLSVRSLFGITSYDFFCSEIDERTESIVYTFKQLYEDIPVENGFFQVDVDLNRNTTFVRGNYVSNIHLDVVPTITHESGIDYLNLKSNERIQEVQLVIYGLGDTEPCLCWKYVISSSNPLLERIVYLHAGSGNVINSIQTNIN